MPTELNQVPFYVDLVFLAVFFTALALFYRAINRNRGAFILVLALALLQALASQRGFYLDNNSMPPRMLFLILPSIILIAYAFISKRGKQFINKLNHRYLTQLHLVRIGVEVVLFWLFINRVVPESMTFEGRNFDIISGITAPFVAYFAYTTKQMGRKWVVLWNLVCLLLVLQVVVTGILSVPSSIQVLSADQPNIAVLYFPYVWLPGIIVPMVLFAHLVVLFKPKETS